MRPSRRLPQPAEPSSCRRWPSPSMGWVAYGTDTEGTMIGVFQMDANAA